MIRPVDPLLHNVPIVDPMGRPTPQFSRLWMQARSVDSAVVSTADSVSGLETDLGTHAAATAGVHGIADTSLLVLGDDVRLTDARVPLPHAASHYSGPGALDLDSIPGTLDASKLHGSATLTTLEITASATLNYASINTAEIGLGLFTSALDFTALGGFDSPFTLSASAPLVPHLDADKLDGEQGSHYLNRANHTGTQDASTLTGTLLDARLSSNVPLKDAANIFLANQEVRRTGAGAEVLVNRTDGTQTYIRSEATRGIVYTSSAHPLELGTSGTAKWRLAPAGHLLAIADNTYDIGASGATRPRDLYVARNIVLGGALDHDGSTVGLYGVTPVVRAAAIAAPAGGATIDAEARTAIDAIRTALTNIGITS